MVALFQNKRHICKETCKEGWLQIVALHELQASHGRTSCYKEANRGSNIVAVQGGSQHGADKAACFAFLVKLPKKAGRASMVTMALTTCCEAMRPCPRACPNAK
jgi:hypothetical protein